MCSQINALDHDRRNQSGITGVSQTLCRIGTPEFGRTGYNKPPFRNTPKRSEEIAKTADFVVRATLVKAKSYLG